MLFRSDLRFLHTCCLNHRHMDLSDLYPFLRQGRHSCPHRFHPALQPRFRQFLPPCWVNETRIAVAKLKDNVDWETMDSSDVKLVILFAVKEADSGAGHIKVLARISIALGDDEVVEKLINASSPEELYRLIINNTGE